MSIITYSYKNISPIEQIDNNLQKTQYEYLVSSQRMKVQVNHHSRIWTRQLELSTHKKCLFRFVSSSIFSRKSVKLFNAVIPLPICIESIIN